MKSKFSDQAMIFRKDTGDRTFYSTTISKKKADGEYENAYIRIDFKKGTDLPNKTLIDIKNGWLTFYPTKAYKKDGTEFNTTQLYVFCNEYEIISKPDEAEQVSGFSQLTEDDIPF